MRRWPKIGLVTLGVIVGVPVALYAGFFLWVWLITHPSDIIDFRPVAFTEKADEPFFYSIGKELKYAQSIDPRARTLFKGKLYHVLVAPDNRKVAVVAEGNLFMITSDGALARKITPVDSIYREPKPLGEQFVRDDHFQWSRDSRLLYFIRDEYYTSKGSQLFSQKGELWAHDAETGKSSKIVAPFRAYKYFLTSNSGVYFSEPDSAGNVVLKHFDGTTVRDLGGKNKTDIDRAALFGTRAETPFYSFSIVEYLEGVLPARNVRLERRPDESEQFSMDGNAILTVSRGKGFKGPYQCLNLVRSVFLPGDRFFLLNAGCGNYEGQLLIDSSTGGYKTLPKDTRVYPVINTDVFSKYRITGSGVEVYRVKRGDPRLDRVP